MKKFFFFLFVVFLFSNFYGLKSSFQPPHEGWAWANSMTYSYGNTKFDFSDIHKEMSKNESFIRRDLGLTSDKPFDMKNICTVRFSFVIT